ncbi:hypothetical protein Bbelb_412000 [Branchiostoma belcheri]|nr:hypothetical protein Bbelb_412000 [Branchiostoma belcheri]
MLKFGWHAIAAATDHDSDKRSAARALPDNPLQYITTEPEVKICEGENVSLSFNLTIPANLTPDRLYERTVWSPDRKNYCFIYGNMSKCHGKDFVQRAEISETWSSGEHGQLMFRLDNVSLDDTGYYEGELKTAYNIDNVNVMLTVKDASACQQKPQDGDTGEKTDPETYWRRGFEGGFGAGFGACLGLVIMGGLAAAIWRYRTKDEK